LGVSTGDAGLEVGGERSGNGNSIIDLHAAAGTDFSARLLRTSGANGQFEIINSGTGGLVFATNSAERARIDSSGNLFVGLTSGAAIGGRLSVAISGNNAGTFICDSANFPLVAWARSSSSELVYFAYGSGGGNVGTITTNGTTTSYNTTSDYRLKHDVKPMVSGLSTVSALKPCIYKWNANNSYGEGFIAHELQAIIPEAVSGEKDAINKDGSIKSQGVDYSKIVVHLVAAIQELKAEFDAYKAAHP
jgi:hypothetical protein